MTITHMVVHEIRYRKIVFALSVLGVAVPIGFTVATWTLSSGHVNTVADIAAKKEVATAQHMEAVQNKYKSIGRAMGHDILLLPSDAAVADVHAKGFSAATVPDTVLSLLASSKAVALDHIVPRLVGHMRWDAYGDDILVCGMGQERVRQPDEADLSRPLPPGFARVGHALCARMSLSAGQQISLGGTSFTVSECIDEQGTRDDITVWVDLGSAQRVLGLHGRVGQILASTNTTQPVETPALQSELDRLGLPLRAARLGLTAGIRQRILSAAESVSRDLIAIEKAHHEALSAEQLKSMALLASAAAACCALWVMVVSLVNIHQRRLEMAILSAVGRPTVSTVALFSAKGLVVGILGVALGIAAAFAVPGVWAATDTPVFGLAISCALAALFVSISVLAHAVPAFLATHRDLAGTLAGG